jgi:N-acetylglucosamine repressor
MTNSPPGVAPARRGAEPAAKMPGGFASIGRINEWRVLRTIHQHGALSRIEVAEAAGVTPPTAARAVDVLLAAGWLIEEEPVRAGRGRPARRLRIPGETLHVIGIVVDGTGCRVIAGGLDGSLRTETLVRLPPIGDYESLLDTIAETARAVSAAFGSPPLGIGVALPGLVDYSDEIVVLCPDVPLLNGRSPARDLAARLGQPCRLLQEDHGLCLAERACGHARGLDEFTLFNVGTSIGLGAISGGSLLMGHCGFAGSIGHITVIPDGRPCGCGNHGCLEAEAGGGATLAAIGRRKEGAFTAEEALALLIAGDPVAREEMERVGRLVAIGVAAAITLFNPSNLFLHCFFLLGHAPLFDLVIVETRRRTLPPSFARCQIARSGVNKLQGAVAGILEHLMNAHLPLALTAISPSSPRPVRRPAAEAANYVFHGGKQNVPV